MAVVLALVSLYGCMQTARMSMQAYKHYYLFFCSQQTLGGSGVAHGTTVMSPESAALYSLLAIFAFCTYHIFSARS